MPEFSPDQLTQLEDALELLDGPRAEGRTELEAPVAARLDDYARVVAVTRVAWPDEEPTPGVLDEVLAQARSELGGSPRVEEAPVPARTRWWFPTFALVGATALILLFVLLPDRGDNAASRDASHVARADAPQSESASTQNGAEKAGSSVVAARKQPNERMVEESAGAEGSALDARDVPSEGETIDGVDRIGGIASASGSSRGGVEAKSKHDSAPPAAAPAVKRQKKVSRASRSDKSKSVWQQEPAGSRSKSSAADDVVPSSLEQADGLRRGGRCSKARKLYKRALSEATNNRDKARAEAGLGLCLAREGKADAQRHFDAALRLDPSLRPWLERERAELP